MEQVAEVAREQAWDAWSEALMENVWHTKVAFQQWGCAVRYLETAGRWEAV